jgi:hypothetical protein
MPTPSLVQIGKLLGYKNTVSLTTRFPGLCAALVKKRQKPFTDRQSSIKGELEKALTVNPPESLDTIAQRLGYLSSSALRIPFPGLCQKIRARVKKYEVDILLSRMQTELDTLLAATPPLSLKAALQKLGVSDGWMRTHFPNEHRLLSKRYLNCRHEQSTTRKAIDSSTIVKIVQELYAKGTFPSMNAVLDIFTASALKRTEVWAIIKQTRAAMLDVA